MDSQTGQQDSEEGSSDRALEPSTTTAATSTNPVDTTSPPAMDSDRLKYHSKDATYFSQLYNQPLVTTLNSFSHVANLVRNPYELINNVDEFVKQASGNHRKYQRTSENFAKILNQNRHSSTPTSPNVQEMDTFVAGSHDQSTSSLATNSQPNPFKSNDNNSSAIQLPIPVLPPIECSTKRGRLEPLTIEEYESKLRLGATDLELIDRVFYGSMNCNQLRAALWPYLFGLIAHRGKFEKITSSDGKSAYVFVEHEANNSRWSELQKLYLSYQAQWKAIMPDQEMRFSTFRERKSLIERDVIRCDRLHPFYAEQPQHLETLTSLLMTYMMYDFDIGYVQGMSDLAGPILFMYNGDLVKSFWIFVEVMKLVRRNFELTQKTIHFQLNCLHELVKTTDPVFAQYLEDHESSNCFFAFRAIVCLFKRELMKEDEDDYTKVLFLWDTIWCAKRRAVLQEEFKALTQDDVQMEGKDSKSTDENEGNDENRKQTKPVTEQPTSAYDNPFFIPFDPNQSDTPRRDLTETEIFVLALCLSMIRRERDIVLANRLDGTDIHLHFIDPKLANDLNGFIEHAINIYSYLKNDFDITTLTSPKEQPTTSADPGAESPPGSAEGYDLLHDFLIIHGSSGA